METNLVVVEQETPKNLISDAVFAAMQDYKRREKATESIADVSELPDAMTAEETLPFLASLGYRTTMRSLYILTHRHGIPYAKFGPPPFGVLPEGAAGMGGAADEQAPEPGCGSRSTYCRKC